MEIKIQPKRSYAYFRRRCTICGGSREKSNFFMAFIDPNDGRREIVCDPCVARGPAAIKQTLLRHADNLRRYAEDLCRLAEADFVVPTDEQIDRNRYEDHCEWARQMPKSCPLMSFEEYVAKDGFAEWKNWFLQR
jgi:hypothetical protein